MTHSAEGQGCWLNRLRSLISLLLEQAKAKSDLTHWYKVQISTLPMESCCGAVLGKFKEYRSLSRMPDGKTCPKKATVLTVLAPPIWQTVQQSCQVRSYLFLALATSWITPEPEWASTGPGQLAPVTHRMGELALLGWKESWTTEELPRAKQSNISSSTSPREKGPLCYWWLCLQVSMLHGWQCQGACQELYFRNAECKAGICSQGLALLRTAASLSIHFVLSIFMIKPVDRRSFTPPSSCLNSANPFKQPVKKNRYSDGKLKAHYIGFLLCFAFGDTSLSPLTWLPNEACN